jgi:molecular chaperone GrpE (heat shock protein)
MTDPIEKMNDADFSAELESLVLEATKLEGAKIQELPQRERAISEKDIRALLKPILDGVESRNTVSKAMFDALHGELKSYKDAFILEAVLRPVIRDMISVFDDLGDTHRQLMATISSLNEGEVKGGIITLVENMRNAVVNLDHNIHFILEVLERLDVTQIPTQGGKLDKRVQKAVSVESTSEPDEDFDIVRTIRRGFQWRERVVRPEEVVIKKWRDTGGKPPQANSGVWDSSPSGNSI